MANEKNSFQFGIAVGIAVLSTVCLAGLMIYIFTGGRSACLAGETTSVKSAKKFETCLASGKYDAQLEADQNLGMQLGIQGTPATFINGYLLSGALSYDMIAQVIDTIIAGKEPDFDYLKDEQTGEIIKVEMPQITANDHQTGAINGQITMVEFSDFECPYCGMHKTTTDQILQNYKDKVTLVFKHFPLSFHQYAKPAAVASECADEQGKFWEMYDKLFSLNLSSSLTTETIKKSALEIGLK